MKTQIVTVLIAIFSLSGLNSFAQDHYSKSEQKEAMKEQRKADLEKLNLRNDQTTEFNNISKTYGKQLRDLRDKDLTREEKKAEAEVLMSAKNAEMKTLLDDAQYATYLEIQEERKKNMKKKRAH